VKRGKATLPKVNFQQAGRQIGRHSGPDETKSRPFRPTGHHFNQNHNFLPEIDGLLTNLCQNDAEPVLIWRSGTVFLKRVF
jgi:hypothetical protein